MKKPGVRISVLLLLLFLTLTACAYPAAEYASAPRENTRSGITEAPFSIADMAPYSGEPYIVVNDNIPYFSEEDFTDQSYEFYSPLDELGRCGAAHASVGLDLMPEEERGNIGHVKPTGWQTVKYDLVDGKYLYNRCHLIGYQLSGENANEQNLITGTRYLNVEGMLPFENMIADYVKETGNHVLYRVTPIFQGDDLVASGVLMEAQSVEDKGGDILFCVYAYNVQPGISIDYATGESALAETAKDTSASGETSYILNTNTKKFHLPDCSSVQELQADNREYFTGSREEVIAQGYAACKRCNP